MQVDLKKLKPAGIVLILLLTVLVIIMCLTTDLGVPKPYESEHEIEYYSQGEDTMNELVAELEENIFPSFTGIRDYHVDTYSMTVVIKVAKADIEKVRLILMRDFDESLFTIIQVDI